MKWISLIGAVVQLILSLWPTAEKREKKRLEDVIKKKDKQAKVKHSKSDTAKRLRDGKF